MGSSRAVRRSSERNPLLMQIFADVLGREISVAASQQAPALGAAMWGAVAAGAAAGGHATITDASRRMVAERDPFRAEARERRSLRCPVRRASAPVHDLRPRRRRPHAPAEGTACADETRRRDRGDGHIGTYLVPRLVPAPGTRSSPSAAVNGSRTTMPWNGGPCVTADRDVEEAAGIFGRRIAELHPDAVVDLICFTPESARHQLDALRPARLLVHCGTIWCTDGRRGSRSPRTSRVPPTASTGSARRRSRRCSIARRLPGACPASSCIPVTSAGSAGR